MDFPKGSEYFRALDLTPLDKVKVVILGQDPYHGDGQAHGLCFSVLRVSESLPRSSISTRKWKAISASCRHATDFSKAGQSRVCCC